MPEDRSVTDVLDSPSDQDQSTDSQTRKTGVETDAEKKIRENLRKEYERKDNKKIQELEAKLADATSKSEARIAQLENMARRTPSQDQELKELLYKADQIESDPNAKPWMTVFERMLEKALAKYDYSVAMDMVIDKAEELGIETEKFKSDLNKYLDNGKYGDKRPTRKVMLALKDMRSFQKLQEKIAKAEEKEKIEKEYSESGGRQSRTPSMGDEFKRAEDSGSYKDVLSKIFDKK